jgi:ESCRT-I complex subunit VPS28
MSYFPPSSVAHHGPPLPPRPSGVNSSSSLSPSVSVSLPSSSAPLPVPLPTFSSAPQQFHELPAIKLSTTREERLLYDGLADLYSLLVTMEHIETAYVRDLISTGDYTPLCAKLIAQYKTLQENLKDEIPSLESFCKQWNLQCKAALTRFRAGVPATILHADIAEAHQSKGKELTVFHAVQHFITAMDSLKLGMKAVDELHPNLTDLLDSINKIHDLPVEHESRKRVREWLMRLGAMRAHEQLSDEEARQMSFDLDTAYNAFHKFVQGNK